MLNDQNYGVGRFYECVIEIAIQTNMEYIKYASQ